MDFLYDIVHLPIIPEDYIKALYETCEDECKEFCCIRKSVIEEIDYEIQLISK